MEGKSIEAGQKTHSESQTMEDKSMEAGQRHTRRARRWKTSQWKLGRDTLGEPDDGTEVNGKSMEAGQKTHSESQTMIGKSI